MYLSLLCFVLMFGLNLWLVPAIGIPDGYMGSAWAALISYFVVMAVSYFLGRHYYPLRYETGKIFLFVVLALALYAGGEYISGIFAVWLTYLVRTLLLFIYMGAVILDYKKSR